MLDDFRRHVNYTARTDLNDLGLVPSWYRFKLNGTNAVIPTSWVTVGLPRCAWPFIRRLQNVSELNCYRKIRNTIYVSPHDIFCDTTGDSTMQS